MSAPKGTPEGGQWIADPGNARRRADDGRVRVAQATRDPSFYQVDLEREELINKRSHAFSRHVNVTDLQLVDILNLHHHIYFIGKERKVDYKPAEGRFLSLQQANELVSKVLSLYPEQVEEAVRGNPRVRITHAFLEPTGIEAFRAGELEIPILRQTFSVRVLIAHEPKNSRGYVVVTAFPMNEFPDEIFQDGK